MVQEWSTCKVEDIAEPQKGSMVTGPFGSSIGSKYWQPKGIPVIRGNNIVFDGPDFIDENYIFISEEYYNSKMKRYTSVKDDIIFTAAGTIGQVGIIPINTKFPFYIVSNKQMRLRVNKKIVDPKFAFYYFRTKQLRELIIANNTGSTIPLINLSVLRNLPFPLAPLAEQRSIASILSVIDDKIELNLQMNKTLEEMAMCLYKHWFVDFGPFQEGEFVESELGMIPKGWEVKSVGDIVKIIGGYAFKSKDFCQEGEKVIKIKNISNNVVKVEGSDCIPSSVAKKTNTKFSIKPGSYLVAMTGAEVGKVGIVPDYQETLWLNQRVGMIGEAEFEFADILVGNFLQSEECYQIIQNLAYGSAQPNISSSGLEGIQMILPKDKSIIRSFLVNIKYWDQLKVDNYTEIQTLTTLRDTLLPKLISGEVRVKEAEEMLEEVM